MEAAALQQPINHSNTRLPDFLLVGAAKSATSSLYYCLDQHPQITMASAKESWFFSFYKNPPCYDSPGVLSDVIFELDEYLKLFDAADSSQILGDACPSYLYTYEDTIKNIHRLYSGEALDNLRIIISLRDPVSRAFSQYYTFKRLVHEPLAFDQAVRQDTIKRRMLDNWNIFYDYTGFGMYSKQVEAFQRAFGKERVLILLYDDIQADMNQVCREIFVFLGLDPEIEIDASVKINSLAGEPRVKWIIAGLFSMNRFKRRISAIIPRRARLMILRFAFENLLKREAMDASTHKRLTEYFEPDILELEKLLARDLSVWRS